ncbi:uncharacterized protein G2W53_040573 [Senna tora]|uniref:Uncharacterized protein n=1 Tax=Senna tora TaxID=362788 RepID=A0A834SDN1_9FABA|nr:uncharacterized protein G2W53_040573 [Senna tora]
MGDRERERGNGKALVTKKPGLPIPRT